MLPGDTAKQDISGVKETPRRNKEDKKKTTWDIFEAALESYQVRKN